MTRKTASDFDPELLRLYDRYVHGGISRRGFLEGAKRFVAGGLTAAAILESLNPDYALAQQVPKDDPRISAEYVTYSSPEGYGTIRGLLARPSESPGTLPGVLVVHENRGLNPYIEDVARRLGAAGFLALAPDGLTPVGGYPGNDDKGRELQASLDGGKMLEDFVAAAGYLKNRPECTGKIGVVGFCYGGFVANTLAVRLPDLAAAVPFYGRQPAAEDVSPDQGPAVDSLCRERRTGQFRLAGLRNCAEGKPRGLPGVHLSRNRPRFSQRHHAPLQSRSRRTRLEAHHRLLQSDASLTEPEPEGLGSVFPVPLPPAARDGETAMEVTVKLSVNGVARTVTTDQRRRLLDVLREEFGLTGSRFGCGEGQCGACTVLIDGKASRSCITPISAVEGKSVTTIEGLAQNGSLHPVQEAFIQHNAMQCGYCTSGMILTTVALPESEPESHRSRDRRRDEWKSVSLQRLSENPGRRPRGGPQECGVESDGRRTGRTLPDTLRDRNHH